MKIQTHLTLLFVISRVNSNIIFSFFQKGFLLLFGVIIFIFTCNAQQHIRTDSIKVKANGNWLKNPWAGGHNYVQLSDIDMNFDGKKDLFVFDRTGHKVSTYINGGTPNTIDYYDSTAKFASKFPHIEDWVLIRDYNCDGLPDICTYAITVGGIKVWKNTSSGGNLQFTLQTPYIKSDYTPSVTTDPLSNLYVSRVDIPTIDDIDNDGDLDVLTFNFSSTFIEFHINQSIELGFGCDSLIFLLDPAGCWGNFEENSNNCSINLIACRMVNPDSSQSSVVSRQSSNNNGQLSTDNNDVETIINEQMTSERHTGSCSLCFDMDADGDKEILIGDISCCNITMLTNGGSPSSANMIAKDTVFPSSNISVNLTIFPCGFFLDVNNDNKRDLIIAPNAPNISIDNESIWYYQNIGTDSAPVFIRKKRSFLQEDMIEVGSGANPSFFDFDNDGFTDLLVSNYSMISDSCPSPDNSFRVNAYKNIGTISSPVFDLVNTDYANLSSQLPNISGKHLTFGDLDNDGDKDMMIGDYNGFIHYFQNTGGAGPANFSTPPVLNYLDDAGVPIDVGSYATPQLIDADRDSDLDLIIGERSGNLNYYENIGTASTPTFTLTSNTFGGVDVMTPCCTGYSVPFMYDSAGSYRLIVGSEASRIYPPMGWLWFYNNIDGNLGGNFTRIDSMYQNIWEGMRMTVNGKDINADGSIDLVIGNYAGGAAIYMGAPSITGISALNHETSFDFTIYPNPFSETAVLRITNELQITNYELKAYNIYGQEVTVDAIRNLDSFVISSGNLLQGVYSCVITSEKFSKAKKFTIIKSGIK